MQSTVETLGQLERRLTMAVPVAEIDKQVDARLKHLFWKQGGGTRPELVEYGPLVLDLETYQAYIDTRPLDSDHDWRTIALVWRKGSPRAEEFRMLADIFRKHQGD